MAANQPEWPREWLMTDERVGDQLWQAIGQVPAGGGIVFRHYRLPDQERLALGLKVMASARASGLVMAVAGSRSLAEQLGADLVHNPDEPGLLPTSVAVHDEVQALAASRAGAALAFIAPVFPTQSHPGAPALGIQRAAELAAIAGCPAIALGGMDKARFEQLESACPGVFRGYAGIDCWLRT